MNDISAVLIVHNEEKDIEGCLNSVSWAKDVVVIDAGSNDQTLEIARKHTNKIYHRNFDSFSNQKNYGIDKATGKWVFSIDADEVVSSRLRESIQRVVQQENGCDGYYVKRTNVIFGKALHFGGQGSEKVLRLFRRLKGRFNQPIHEKVSVNGKVGNISGELLHFSIASVDEYMRKLLLYTELEAKWMAENGVKATRIEMWTKPALRFVYYYLLRLGILDGYEGLLYHSLSSFYSFFKYARLREMDRTH